MTNPVAPVNPVPATNTVEPVAPPNPAPVVEPVKEANIVAAPAPIPVPATNTVVQTNVAGPVNAVARTNDLGAPPESSGSGHAGALILGGGLLVAAGALAAFAFFRARRADRGSLITRTMNRK
jgi:outer membrane biosynthesis protein TonB